VFLQIKKMAIKGKAALQWDRKKKKMH